MTHGNDKTGPAESLVEDAQTLVSQPTAPEMSRPTNELRDLRVSGQEEAGNDFAHLLNSGSSLE